MEYELGFLGAGQMAEAIARAAIQGNVLSPAQIIASDPAADRRSVFAQLGVATSNSNSQVVQGSRHVLVAVKPQTLDQLAPALVDLDVADQIVMSIMAGITIARIEKTILRAARIVRIMPNTPVMAGCGMAAIALGLHARAGDDELAMRLFSAAGEAIQVDEAMMDAITAVSGSGPAYVFYLAEGLEQAAAQLGLSSHARMLVRQTILGAAKLMERKDMSPAELRRQVTSPGGTTEAAVNHLDGNATMDVIVNAVKAAAQRSRQLGS